jgi:hypothetical protein
MVRKPTDVPVVDLFYTTTGRKLTRFVIEEMGDDEQLQKHEIMDGGKTKAEMTRQYLDPDDGHMIRYGVLGVVDPDVSAPFYRKAESHVVSLLESWPLTEKGRMDSDDRPPLLTLFDKRGKCQLFEFFVGGRCNPEKAYSKNELKEKEVGGHQTTGKYLPTFVEAGLVEEVEGKRGAKYKKGTNEDFEGFLVELNEALYEAHRDTIEA